MGGVGRRCSVRHQWMVDWYAGCLTSRSLRAAGDFAARQLCSLYLCCYSRCSAVQPGLHLPVDALHANDLSPPLPYTLSLHPTALHTNELSPLSTLPSRHQHLFLGKMSYIKILNDLTAGKHLFLNRLAESEMIFYSLKQVTPLLFAITALPLSGHIMPGRADLEFCHQFSFCPGKFIDPAVCSTFTK